MKHLTGFLIRQARLDRNISQEGLCKGICAVSYLSKIERGQAEPGEDIVRLLFAALNIDYTQDEAILRPTEEALRRFFDCWFHDDQEGLEAAAQQIDAAKDNLVASRLHIAFQLYALFQSIEAQGEDAHDILSALSPLTQYMDTESMFLYLLGKAYLTEDRKASLALLGQAKVIYPCSVSYYEYAARQCQLGYIQEALKTIEEGFHMAVDEGMLKMMSEFCLLEGNCYAILFNRELMLRAYKRGMALNRGNANIEASTSYNIGATLLELRRYDEALPYLLRTLQPEKGSAQFLPYQKLALCYEGMGHKEEGLPYLRQAEEWAVSLEPIYQQLIRVVSMRYEDGFLDSDDYLHTLRYVYDNIQQHTGFGFRQFHGLYLIEVYTHRRKYKEALAISQEIYWPLS